VQLGSVTISTKGTPQRLKSHQALASLDFGLASVFLQVQFMDVHAAGAAIRHVHVQVAAFADRFIKLVI
jgi:hypothetical protein